IGAFQSDRYLLANSLFRNVGDGTFADLSEPAGLEAAPPRAHRGAAFADLDGDGRVDVVTTALQAPAELWWNQSPAAGHWLEVRLTGTKSNREGIGAAVKLSADGDPHWRVEYGPTDPGGGYSAS